MAINKPNIWYRARITFVKETDSSDTFSVDVVSKQTPEGADANTQRPILKEISGLGSALRDHIIEPTRATLVLDNTPGTLGSKRRFIDLFDGYTCIDQNVDIQYAEIVANSEDPTGDFTTIWKSKVSRVSTRSRGGEIALEVESNAIERGIITAQLSADSSQSVNNRSAGKAIPIVFGEQVQVRPIFRGEGDFALWAYATTLSNQFGVGGVNEYKVRDHTGQYSGVNSVSSMTTGVLGRSSTTANTLTPVIEYAWRLEYNNSSDNHIITHIQVTLKGNNSGSGTVGGVVTLRVYRQNRNNFTPGDTPIAEGAILKSDHSASYLANLEFDVIVPLDRPVICTGDENIYFSLAGDNETGASQTLIPTYDSGSSNDGVFHRGDVSSTTDGQNTWRNPGSLTSRSAKFTCYGVLLSDDPSPSGGFASLDGGFGVANFLAEHRGFDDGDSPLTSLAKLDFLLDVNGFKDDGSGTITGSANSIVKNPKHAAKLLSYEYNGSSWVAGKLDLTHFSGTHTTFDSGEFGFREIKGQSRGRLSRRQLLGQIARDCGFYLSQVNATTEDLALWAWGTQVDASIRIDDKDFEFLRFEVQGTNTVVNHAQGTYKHNFEGDEFLDATTQNLIPRGYESQSLLSGNDSSGIGKHISEESYDTFGERPLKNNVFDWLSDDTSVESRLKMVLAQSDVPARFVVGRVPYQRYQDLTPLGVVELSTVTLPSFQGTDSNAKLPNYLGTPCEAATAGEHFRRSNTFKCFITRYDLIVNLNEPPTIEFTARLLIHKHDPT